MTLRIAPGLLCLALLGAPCTAQADGIELSGTAEMGLVGGAGPDGGTRTRLMTDLELQVRMSTTTDGGLTIGVEIDLDDLVDDDPSLAPTARTFP